MVISKHIWYFVFIIIILTGFNSITAQSLENRDRLRRLRDLSSSSELIIIWNEGEHNDVQTSYQQIYDLDLTQSDLSKNLVPSPLQSDSSETGHTHMAVASGNFLGNAVKQFVAAWSGPQNSIRIMIPDINPNTMSWEHAEHLSLPGPLDSFGTGNIRLTTGDFNGNKKDDIVLAYHGADSTIHLQVLTFKQGNTVPEPAGSINDEKLYLNGGTRHDRWDMISGDFNGDSIDEIALFFVKPIGTSNWALYAKIYSVDDQGNPVPQASKQVFINPGYFISNINIGGAGGYFDDNVDDMEIAFGFSFAQNEQGSDTYVYLLDVQNNLADIVVSDYPIGRDAQNESEITPLAISVGDLNGDYIDEIILSTNGSHYIYETNGLLQPEYKFSGGGLQLNDNDDSYYFVAVEDMDADGRSDIVTAANFVDEEPGGMQYLQILVQQADTALTKLEVRARRNSEHPVSNNWIDRHFAIALGDFNGDRSWLGSPVHYSRKAILQPSVILNTPPVHYDILDSVIYDLSGCYPGQSCGFSSTYTQTLTTDQTVTVEIHEDWGVSEGIDVTVPGFKVEAERVYGEKFSKRSSSTKTMKISTGRVAAGEDWIYANIYDINFYEYPVYDGQDPTPIGYFMVSVPKNVRPLWIETKDDQLLGNTFLPDHEVSNILSYRTTDTEDLSEHIIDFEEQTVGSTGSSFASLTLKSFTSNGVDTSWESGKELKISGGGEFDFFGIEVGLVVKAGANYKSGELVTQTVSVNQSLEIRGDFGHLETEFGTSGTYQITPYAYWTSYGALALDYKVAIPEGDNFWQQNYSGKTDIAFSLPWRFDQQKGIPFPGNDPSYRYRTRDIAVNNPAPQGGDTVTVGARIRNMALQDITTDFPVRFYLGNPNTGGSLIAETICDTVIAARGSYNIFIDWIIPVETKLPDARIYVLLDPDNDVTGEVHEDNNMGWAPLISLGTSTGITSTIIQPGRFELHQVYPNPFNPSATIRYTLGAKANVSVKIYNIIGQEIATITESIQEAGEYKVLFNAESLASGLYFCQLTAMPVNGKRSAFRQTRKMMYIK